MKKQTIYQVLVFLLILLWTYSSLSKLINYNLSRNQMLNQVFPRSIALVLTWLIPSIELITALLLSIPTTSKAGLANSFTLLSIFTLYILGGVLHFYARVPCSCGGVIRHLSWEWHLIFNLFFLGLNLYALILNNQERRKWQENN
jgi:putative oxidoreductase